MIEFELSSREIAPMFLAIAPFAGKPDERFGLVALSSDGTSLQALATDGMRLGLVSAPCELPAFNCPFARAGVDRLRDLLRESDSDQVQFSLGVDSAVVTTYGVPVEIHWALEKFPDTAKVRQAAFGFGFPVSARELRRALRSAKSAGQNGVTLTGAAGKLTVSARGEAPYKPIDLPADVPDFKVHLNAKYLLESLNQIDGSTILSMSGALDAVGVRGMIADNVELSAWIMPIRAE